jgi:DNA-binding MarR family transcriptional regulator
MLDPYYSADTLVPDQSVGYLIKRSGALMTQIAERTFESQPISFTQWVILMWLSDRPYGSPSELSAQIGHDMGALTRVADHLERAGLVSRERSQHDRRAVEIAITPEGRRLASGGKRVIVDLLNKLVEPYTRTEIESFIALLQKFLVQMQVFQAQAQTQTPAKAAAIPAEPPRARGSKHEALRPRASSPRTTRRAPRRKPME